MMKILGCVLLFIGIAGCSSHQTETSKQDVPILGCSVGHGIEYELCLASCGDSGSCIDNCIKEYPGCP